MPLLNFKRQFVDPIRLGTKRHTIRAERKVPIKAGDLLYLYCGLRREGAFRILPDPQICTKALPIHIHLGYPRVSVAIADEELSRDEIEALARADGFTDWNAMAHFWIATHGSKERIGFVDFHGQIIHWNPAVNA
jgi:hypothetical protein